MEVILEDGTMSTLPQQVLDKWKKSFETLYNIPTTETYSTFEARSPLSVGQHTLNNGIDLLEIEKAVKSLNKNKAPGYDGIPAETLNNKLTIYFLHSLFNVCFDTGSVPSTWQYGFITPILKCSNFDKRDPSNYRGITVTSAIYKAYCSVLNNRLTKWVETNNILSDTQNGFRPQRSTIDQLSTLTNIVDARKKSKKDTFVAYVDFSKAYDRINRHKLWSKLENNYG